MSTTSSHAPSRSPASESSTHTLDITTPSPQSRPPNLAPPNATTDTSTHTSTPMSTSNHHHPHSFRRHYRMHPSFNSAYHRIISRQERQYDCTNPSLVRETIDVAEERRQDPIRERALAHVTRAYVAVGYTHATLSILVALVCAALLLAISYSVASDVARKTRDRAADLLSSAADCEVHVKQNQCVIDGNHVSHSSYEMAALCKKWVQCARRGRYADADARSAKIWAETLSDIANTFGERLSATAVVVLAVLIVIISVFFSSSTFTFLHRRVVEEPMMAPSAHPHAHLISNRHTPRIEDHSRQQSRFIGYKDNTLSRERRT